MTRASRPARTRRPAIAFSAAESAISTTENPIAAPWNAISGAEKRFSAGRNRCAAAENAFVPPEKAVAALHRGWGVTGSVLATSASRSASWAAPASWAAVGLVTITTTVGRWARPVTVMVGIIRTAPAA
jgi:hypothetical protein